MRTFNNYADFHLFSSCTIKRSDYQLVSQPASRAAVFKKIGRESEKRERESERAGEREGLD